MITIATVENFLKSEGRHVQRVTARRGATVREYAPIGFENSIVLHNDKPCGMETVPHDWDRLTFIKRQHGIDWAAVILTSIIASIIGTGLSFLISLLIPPPDSPKGFNDSPTYSWQGIRTQALNGVPIPRVYGEHLIGGNVIQAFTRAESLTDTRLYLILALGSGEFHEIAGITEDEDNLTGDDIAYGMLTINGRNVADFEGVSVSIRHGAWDQEPIKGLASQNVVSDTTLAGTKILAYTHDTPDENMKNYSDWIEILNNTYEADYAEINILFPAGFYYASDDGPDSVTVQFRVQYRENGETDWIDIGWVQVNGKKYGQPVLTINTRTIKQAGGRFSNLFTTIDTYDLRIRKYNFQPKAPDNPDNAKMVTGCEILSVNWVREEQIAYRGTALVAIEALATDQLNGAMPQVRIMVQGDVVTVYSGSAWVTQYSTNPAWICADILTDKLNGLGAYFNTAGTGLFKLSTSTLQTFAAHCVTESLPFNGVFDTVNLSAWDALLRVCMVGRAKPIQAGNTVEFVPEKARTPVQMFNMGNITQSSFLITYLNPRERPNLVEVQFLNRELNFERDTVQLEDPNRATDEPPRKKTYDMPGITYPDQALKMATFILNTFRYLDKRFEFTAGLDAVVCRAGDVVYLHHDIPNWDYSGRVRGGDTTHLVCDRAISTLKRIKDGTETLTELGSTAIEDYGAGQFRALVMHNSGTFEAVKTITGNPIDYAAGASIEVTEAFSSAPVAGEKFAIGLSTSIERKAIITKITLKPDFSRQIEAIQYDSRIYDINPAPWDNSTFTGSGNAVGLQAVEFGIVSTPTNAAAVASGSGTGLELTWMPGTGLIPAAAYAVYYRAMGDSTWNYAGSTAGTAYSLSGLAVNTEYELSVCPVSPNGDRAPAASGARFTAGTAASTETGSTEPNHPDEITIKRLGDLVRVEWEAQTGIDHYELRRGAIWQTGEVVYRGPANTIETRNWVPTVSGTPETWILRAVDAAGNHSRGVELAKAFGNPFFEFNYTSIDYGYLGTAKPSPNIDYPIATGVIHGLSYDAGGQIVTLGAGNSATFTSNPIELDELQYACIYILAAVTRALSLTVADAGFALNSPMAAWDLNGPLGNECPPTVDESTDTLDSLGETTIDQYTVSAGTYGLEIRTTEDGISWGDWETYTPEWREFLQAQYRFTLTMGTELIEPKLTGLQATVSTRYTI